MPDFTDRGINASFHVDKYILIPQLGDDVCPQDELPAMFDQQNKEVHRLPLESDRPSVMAQLIAGDIELEVAKAERLFGSRFDHFRW
jgi:hypothetical protein